MLTIELVAHMDAGDRRLWTRPQDERPLSGLGLRQAALVAEALLAERFDALFSSPAMRCIQTLRPIAQKSGLEVEVLTALRETAGFPPPPGWRLWDIEQNHPLGGAYAAGRALQALREIRSRQRQGRVAACSHGDVVPALVAALAGIHGLEAPPPHDRRGGWHTLRLDGDAIEIELQPLLPDFPN